MRALSLLALAACGHAGTAPRPTQTARSLDDVILAGVEATFDDACYSGPLWGAVDAEAGRQRLDAAFTHTLARAARSPRDQVCAETLAIARLRRAERTHTLDVLSELGHPAPDAREIAARYCGTATIDAAAAAKLRDLLSDPNQRVRLAAHDAVAARHDQAAVPILQAIAARHDEARPLACTTLRTLGAPGDCEPHASPGGLGLLTGGGPAVDYCKEAHDNIAAPDVERQRKGMLFFLSEQFSVVGTGLWFLPEAHDNPCLLDGATRERMLGASDLTVRAIAAATTVWATSRFGDAGDR